MTEYKKQEILRKLDNLLEWTSVNPLEDKYSHMICEILYSVVKEIKAEDGGADNGRAETVLQA